MRTAWIALLAVALAAGLGLLTLARVPADGAVLAWRESTGDLRIPAEGWSLLPRWSYRRLPAAPIETRVAAASRDGIGVAVELVLSPAPGDYRLAPAPDPAAGLAAGASEPVRAFVETVAAGCLAPEAPLDEGCPGDLSLPLARAVAAAIGAEARQLRLTFKPDPAGMRELLLADLAAGLPRPDRRVLVLGLDGFDWDLVLPWVEAGDMPELARLLAIGTWGELETLVPMLSPLIWTTIATGVDPDRHGILDFVEKDPRRGVMVPVTGRSRKVPAVWNLASALGRTVSVVGWWGSWPADPIGGVMVSDRLYYTLTQGLEKAVLRQDPPGMISPAERGRELVALRDRTVRETDWEAVRSFMDVPRRRFDEAVAADRGMDDPVDGFRRILAASRTYLGAGLRLASDRPDLLMVYLEGTDTVGHLLAPYLPPPTLDVDAVEAAVYAGAVPRYFREVDRWIGRFLEHYPPSEAAILIVSDHGFKWHGDRPTGLSGTAGPTAPLWHAPDAVFLAAGRGVGHRGRVGEPASVYDVAPTVMALLGLPLGAGWPGSVLPGCSSPTLEALEYERLVPPESYQGSGGAAAPVDPEFIAKLKSLGYLGGGAAPADRGEPAVVDPVATAAALPPAAAAAPPPEPSTDATVTRGELNNLAVIKINKKEYGEAERLLRQAIALSPSYASPHYNLRRIYMETARYDDADRELWTAVDKGLRDPERTVDRAAQDYDNLDLQDRTVTILTEALRRFPGHEPFWVHLLVARIRLGQCAAGLEPGAEAARRFPASAPVHAFYGLAAACAGDVATARAEIERSLSLNPDQETLRGALADLPE